MRQTKLIKLLGNHFFRFKQFTVWQDRCAMKVTTTACIQGAWTPDIKPAKILDIGAGTGILSFMCAQKFGAATDAVEIDHNAFHQLTQNISLSPWPELIRPFNTDIRLFEAQTAYDFIICNPPFYQSSLKSPFSGVNKAKHNTTLSLRELATLLPVLLHENGTISILLPPSESHIFHEMARMEDMHLAAEMQIHEYENSPCSAVVSYYMKNPAMLKSLRMVIRHDDGTYSDRFTELMRPYYLNM